MTTSRRTTRVGAISFLRELRAQCRKIMVAPQAYRSRPELGEGIRSCAYGNYEILFIEDGRLLRIIRVLHGAMDIEAQLAGGGAGGSWRS